MEGETAYPEGSKLFALITNARIFIKFQLGTIGTIHIHPLHILLTAAP